MFSSKAPLHVSEVAIERCVGCGICETKCPLLGAAGIRVVPTRNAAVTPEMAGTSG